MREPRGLPRLRALFANWMRRTSVEIDSGCIYISGAVEFDDRPGPVRDALAGIGADLARGARPRRPACATRPGHLRADTDEAQMLFEIHGLILALHYEARFLRIPGSLDRARAGFDRILDALRHAAPGARRSRRRAGRAQAAR